MCAYVYLFGKTHVLKRVYHIQSHDSKNMILIHPYNKLGSLLASTLRAIKNAAMFSLRSVIVTLKIFF